MNWSVDTPVAVSVEVVSVAVGGVAPRPWRLDRADALLPRGSRAVADALFAEARPTPENAFKLPLVERTLAAGLSQPSAVRIREVQEGSPAAQAGLTNNDLIVRLDGEKVTGVDDLFRILDERRIDTDVAVTVVRGGVPTDITVRPIDREQAQ